MNFLSKLFGWQRAGTNGSAVKEPAGEQIKQTTESVPDTNLLPQKVLFILPWLPVGGVETLFTGLVKQLSPNYQFELVTTRETLPNMGDRTESFEAIGCPVTHLPRLSADDEERKKLLLQMMEKGRFGNVFQVGSTLAYELLPEMRRSFPKLNIIDQQFNDGKHLVSNCKLHNLIDATIVPSSILNDKLQNELGVPSAKVHIIPHGIEIPDEKTMAADLEQGRKTLPAKFAGKFVITFLGRLSPEKDPEMFVRIVERLKKYDDMDFCMVGDGPERDNVLALMDKLNVRDNIFYCGFVDRIDPIVAASSVIVVPSINDGQPLVVLHAQVHGRAIVASSAGSIPLMIENENSGMIVNPGDLDTFVAKIELLHNDAELHKRLGENAFKRVRELFDEHQMVEKYRSLLLPV